ncbi:hypothetical protein [Acidiphilium acidophilum]|jgi:hypothetical protein|uniref:hypothetical protein n=1 Tax=Acidiphilium acidophilum TaxID=76588 RepID=UPI002E8E726B|nr:hypothetical protein [Acidiphilium acidophilum]
MPIEDTDDNLAENLGVEAKATEAPKKEEVLSFRFVNRIITESGVKAEFEVMLSMFKKPPAPADFQRVGAGSGSHLLKLTTPRAESKQSVLRCAPSGSNALPFFAPSLNAPDIPYAKVVYRPLEIMGRAPKSVVDHIREPDEISEAVLGAFASVFGAECLDALQSALFGSGHLITSLPDAGEFPIIFLPRPGGGDIQATPVSPVEVFMGFKDISQAWHLKQEKDAPPVPRGRWIRQSISAKPQNISGMIGGGRKRFLAEMPKVMGGYDAALLRYAQGGKFPAWKDSSVGPAVLRYAERLEKTYTNSEILANTDKHADRLITGALDFITQVKDDTAELLGVDIGGRTLPNPSALIMRRRWGNDEDRAIKALTSHHFRDREQIALKKKDA